MHRAIDVPLSIRFARLAPPGDTYAGLQAMQKRMDTMQMMMQMMMDEQATMMGPAGGWMGPPKK